MNMPSWENLVEGWDEERGDGNDSQVHKALEGWWDSVGIWDFFFFFFSLFPLIHRCGMCYLCAMSGRALALVKTLLPCSGSFSCLPWLAAQVALQKIESCTHSHTKKNNMLLHVIIIGLSYGVPGWLIWSLCKENGLLSG